MIARWIKSGPFQINPRNIDPGQVVIHRLNRLEYRNTIRDLLGVSYNTEIEFPPDAAGIGLDNIAELLTMSPLMLEKYLDAAEAILEGAYPTQPTKTVAIQPKEIRGNNNSNGEFLSFNNPPEITYTYRNKMPGSFRVVVQLEVVGLSDKDKQQITDVLAAAKKAEEEKAAAQKAGVHGTGCGCTR